MATQPNPHARPPDPAPPPPKPRVPPPGWKDDNEAGDKPEERGFKTTQEDQLERSAEMEKEGIFNYTKRINEEIEARQPHTEEPRQVHGVAPTPPPPKTR